MQVKFKIILISPQARGLKDGPTEVWVVAGIEFSFYRMNVKGYQVLTGALFLKWFSSQVEVKVNSQEDDSEYIWDRNKFMNRKFLMQEMYQNYVEGDEWDVPQVSDV